MVGKKTFCIFFADLCDLGTFRLHLSKYPRLCHYLTLVNPRRHSTRAPKPTSLRASTHFRRRRRRLLSRQQVPREIQLLRRLLDAT